MRIRATPVVVAAATSATRLRASIAATYPTVTADLRYIHASTAAVQPILDVSYAIPVTAVSYIELAVGATVDETGRYRYVTDTSVVLDAVFLATAKTFIDSVSTSDFATVAADKGLFDTANVSDSAIIILIFIRNFADSVGISEQAAFTLVKALTDTAVTSDQLNFALTKVLADGVGMIDSFDLNDGATYTFTKSLSNVSFATDVLVKALQRALTETVTVSSAGFLTSQGYCDPTYFAEDYVGESRTFT